MGSGPAAAAAGAVASGAAPGSAAGSGGKEPVAGAPAAARGRDAGSARGAAGAFDIALAAARQDGNPFPWPDPVVKINLQLDIEALYGHMGPGHPWQGLREDLRGELRRGHRGAREAEGWLADAWLGSLQPVQTTPEAYSNVRCYSPENLKP